MVNQYLVIRKLMGWTFRSEQSIRKPPDNNECLIVSKRLGGKPKIKWIDQINKGATVMHTENWKTAQD